MWLMPPTEFYIGPRTFESSSENHISLYQCFDSGNTLAIDYFLLTLSCCNYSD